MPVKNPLPNHTCDQCGKPYYRKWQQRFVSKFCSRACMYEAHKGQGNPHFKHGFRTGKDNHRARMGAKARMGGVCVVCQWPMGAEVHHIVPKAEGGSDEDENLTLLCPNHHWMAHRGYLPTEVLQCLTTHHHPTPTALSEAAFQAKNSPIMREPRQ